MLWFLVYILNALLLIFQCIQANMFISEKTTKEYFFQKFLKISVFVLHSGCWIREPQEWGSGCLAQVLGPPVWWGQSLWASGLRAWLGMLDLGPRSTTMRTGLPQHKRWSDGWQPMVHIEDLGPVEDIWDHSRKQRKNIWTTTPAKWLQQIAGPMKTLRSTVSGNGHWKGFHIHKSAKSTTIQNYCIHLGGIFKACTTLGPWIDIGWPVPFLR